MAKTQVAVVEQAAEESAVVAPAAIKIVVTAVIEVTPSYLSNIEGSTKVVRECVEALATALDGSVVSVQVA